MKIALRILALGAGLSVAAIAAAPMMGMVMNGIQDQDQDHHDRDQQQSHQDYSNNRYYQVGNREGYEDYQHKTQRKVHDHKYRNDDDRKAHNYGYQQGWQGQRYGRDHDHSDQR